MDPTREVPGNRDDAAAVVGHFGTWPRVWRGGLPWLTECEGLDGPAIGPYNVILQLSAVAAVAGLYENRRHWRSGAAAAVLLSAVTLWATPREYAARVKQAAEHPSWWNRRLVALPDTPWLSSSQPR